MRSRARKFLLWLGLVFAGATLASCLAVLALRWVPPATTSFILRARVASWFDGEPGALHVQRSWRERGRISPQLQLAVIASEDQRFLEHNGFDFRQIRIAMDEAEGGGRSRGASTITQQVARNLFLWPGRSWIRKGLEAWFTLLIEWCWPKQRILEMYLNVAEFGRGIYGAEAAARAHFGKAASQLNRPEAARLAAVLPSPRRMDAGHPSRYVLRRQGQIEAQMMALGGTSLLAPLDENPSLKAPKASR